jgi:hypothetical protein
MFGHQDEPTQQTNSFGDQPSPVVSNDGGISLPPADNNSSFGAPAPAAPAPPVTDPNQLLESQADHGTTNAPSDPVQPTEPAAPEVTTHEEPAHDEPAEPATVGAPGPLSDLKQQALQQLSPLVGQLEQTPEEKFRTTMMMIQASDNQDLLQTAYEAANQITDEKAKAQALLDVINEINYFSQKNA